jgi:hypothetical protein
MTQPSNPDDVAAYYQARYANTCAARVKWVACRKRSMLVLFAFAGLVAISFGFWEFTCSPSTIAVGIVWFASFWSISQAQYLLWHRPQMRSARRELFAAMEYEPPAEAPNARPVYRMIAGLLAVEPLLAVILALRGKMPAPTFIPAGIFYGFEFILFWVFAYLAITGRWILGGNRPLGRG